MAGERWVPDYINYAAHVIAGTTGDDVGVLPKAKPLYKFGRNRAIGTSYETVWELGGDEALPTSNVINRLSSTNANDDQTFIVEGHTINAAGDELTFVTQMVTLNGQTPVEFSTPLARCTRLFNTSSTYISGDVYAYQSTATVVSGEPQEASLTHILVNGTAGENQSLKTATAISSQDYFIVTELFCGVIEKTSAFVDAEFQVKELNGVWETQALLAASAASGVNQKFFNPPIIVPPNNDIRIRARSGSTGIDTIATMNGYLARIR